MRADIAEYLCRCLAPTSQGFCGNGKLKAYWLTGQNHSVPMSDQSELMRRYAAEARFIHGRCQWTEKLELYYLLDRIVLAVDRAHLSYILSQLWVDR